MFGPIIGAVKSEDPCPVCGGSGRDPKKRKLRCPRCYGHGKNIVCGECGKDWPCDGYDPKVFDQSRCSNVKDR